MGKSRAKKKINQEELNKTKKYKIKASKKIKNDKDNKKTKKKHRILKMKFSICKLKHYKLYLTPQGSQVNFLYSIH